MFNDEPLTAVLGFIVVSAPFVLVLLLGILSLVGRPLGEQRINRVVQASVVTGLLAAVAMLFFMLINGPRRVPVELGHWVEIPNFHFAVKLEFDRLSVPFVILSFTLCGTIGKFASRYMHREPGYNRFFFLYALFLLGMVVTSLAGNIETLFAGWELVGISSALLVAFFHERTAPVRNGLRVWSVYRVSDAALLVAAVGLHHLTGHGDFRALLGAVPWPDGNSALSPNQAVVIGLLLIVAAAGKSALVPFSGWLPRAMEGPTPSSAIFYGALSVHLGAFLLLRVAPIIEQSMLLCAVVVMLGTITAVHAAFTGRVQTDIKSALSYASLTQVGIIVAEIGLGVPRYITLIHIIGHACLRTLQFLRAPTLLHDYHSLENAIGSHLPHALGYWSRLPAASSAWLYRFAMERGYLDSLLYDYVARPILALFQWCDSMERRWTDWLTGAPSRESDRVGPSAGSLDDL